MLLKGVLQKDLHICLALRLEKVIVICGIPDPEPKQAFKKIQCGSEGMMASPKRPQLDTQCYSIYWSGQNAEHKQTYCVLPVSHTSPTFVFFPIHLQMPKLLL